MSAHRRLLGLGRAITFVAVVGILFTPSAQAVITVQNVSNGAVAFQGGSTFSGTLYSPAAFGAGANGMLIVTFGCEQSTNHNIGATVTWNGVAMNLAVTGNNATDGDTTDSFIYYLANPTYGTGTLAVTLNSTAGGVVTRFGVDSLYATGVLATPQPESSAFLNGTNITSGNITASLGALVVSTGVNTSNAFTVDGTNSGIYTGASKVAGQTVFAQPNPTAGSGFDTAYLVSAGGGTYNTQWVNGNLTSVSIASFAAAPTGNVVTWTGAFPPNGLPDDHAWSDPDGVNWGFNSPPGTTSSIVNGDTARFAGGGNGFTSINIDANRVIGNITFDSAAAAAYTIGDQGVNLGNALGLASGGFVTVTSTVTTAQTFNAPLVIKGTSSNFSFTNLSTTAAATLTVASGIKGEATAANTTTLFLSGSNTGNNTISGVISDGTAGGKLAVSKSGTGTWILNNAANAYTGGLAIAGGTLILPTTNASPGTVTVNGGTLNVVTGALGSSGNITFGSTPGGGVLQYATSVATPEDFAARFVSSTGAIALDVNGKTLTNAVPIVASNTGGVSYSSSLAGGNVILNAGNLYLGGTTINNNVAVVLNTASGLGATSGALTVTAGGAINLAGTSPTVAGLADNGTQGATSTAVITSSSGTPTLTITDNNKSFGGTIGSNIALVANTGAGTFQVLSGNNTYTGTTTINGELEAWHINALGATSAGTSVASTGTLALKGTTDNLVFAAEPLSLAGTAKLVLNQDSTLRTATYSGPITLASGANPTFATAGNTGNAGTLIITGGITVPSGTAGVTIDNTNNPGSSATVVFDATTNPIAYNGNTIINSGTLKIKGADNVLPVAGTLTLNGVNSAAGLDLNGQNQTVATLNSTSITSFITNSGASAKTLTINGTSSFAGRVINGTSPVAIAPTGGSTLTLTGTSTFSGGTTIAAGNTVVVGPVTAGDPLGAGAVNLTGGTLTLQGTNAVTSGLTLQILTNNSLPNINNQVPAYNSLSSFNSHIASIPPVAGNVTVNTNLGGKTNLDYSNVAYSSASMFNTNSATQAVYGFSSTNNFETKFAGYFNAVTAGSYTFTTTSDDGNCLFLDNADVPLVSNNAYQGATTKSGTVTLTAGLHPITIGFYEGGGGLGLLVQYTPPLGALTTIPNSLLSTESGSFATTQAYANNVVVTADSTINIANSPTASLGTLTIGSNTLHVAGPSGTNLTMGATTLTGNATVDLASNAKLSLGAITGGANSLATTGTGTLILTAGGTYSGGTTINAGSLQVVNTTGSATGSGTVTMGTGTSLSGTGSISGNVALGGNLAPGIAGVNNGIGTLNLGSMAVSSGSVFNYDLANLASYDKAVVTGGLTLAGANTINVNALAGLTLGNYNLVSTTTGVTGAPSFTINHSGAGDNAQFQYSVVTQGNNLVLVVDATANTWTGAANNHWNFTDANWTTSPYTDNTNKNVFADGPTNNNIIIDATVAPLGVLFSNATTSYSFTGAAIGGTGAIVINGGASVTFNSANTYTNGTTLLAGTLNLNNANAIGGGGLIIGGGTLDNTSGGAIQLASNNAMNWSGNFAYGGSNDLHLGNGAVLMTTNITLTANAGTGGKLTVGGAISDAGNNFSFTKAGTGTVTLASPNTYGGLTQVTGGKLILAAANTNTGGTTIAAGTLQLGDGVTNNGSVVGNITNNGNLTIANPNAQTVTNNINGSGTLTKSGSGVLTLQSTSNTYGGKTFITAGTLKIIPSTAGLFEAAITGNQFDETTAFPTSGVNFNGVSLGTPKAHSTASQGTLWTNFPDNTTIGYTGYINNTSNVNKTYTFVEQFDDNILLKIDGNQIMRDTAWNVPTKATVTLTPGSHTFQLRLGQGGGGVGPSNNPWPDATPFNAATAGFGFAYDPTGSNSELITAYQKMVDPGDGSLFTTTPYSVPLPATTGVVMSSNTTLDMSSGGSLTIGSLSDDVGVVTGHTVLLGNGTLITGGDGTSTTFSGVISGTGANLTKTGAGNMTLTNDNTYTGATTVNGGTLTIGNGTTGTISASSAVAVGSNGTLSLNLANGSNFTNTITSSGAVKSVSANSTTISGAVKGGTFAQTGTGTTTLTNTNGLTGTTVNAGTLVASHNGTLGFGPVTLGGGKLVVTTAQASGGAPAIVGFGTGSSWAVNGGATFPTTDTLQLTDNNNGEARSTFFNTQQAIAGGFTANFTYNPSGGTAGNPADGAAFVIQNVTAGTAAIGGSGGGLGYGGNTGTNGFGNNGVSTTGGSVAVELNVFSGNTPGTNLGTNSSTGGYAAHGMPWLLGTGNVLVGNPINVSITYDPTAQTITENVQDNVVPANHLSVVYTGQNLSTLLGSNNAWIGFTGGTGGANVTQQITNFQFLNAQPGGKYVNNVLLTGGTTSTIQVAADPVTQVITMGNLTIQSGGTPPGLHVTPDPTVPANQAYGLTLGTVTLNNSVTLTVDNNGTGTGTLTLGGISDLAVSALVKTGLGTLALTAPSNHSGGTTVQQGTLQITNTSGSATGAGVVTIATPATLTGTGSAGGLVRLSGHLAPGLNGVGTIGLGSITFQNATTVNLDYDLGPLNGSDKAVATGALTMTNATAATLNVNALSGLFLGNYPLIAANSIVDLNPPPTWTINHSGPGDNAGFTYNVVTQGNSLVLVVDALPNNWTGSVNNHWNFTDANWSTSPYTDGTRKAVFGDSGMNTNITIDGTVSPLGVVFNNTTAVPYTLGGADISGLTGLTLNGSGTVTLTGSNTYTGITTINNGTLSISSDSALGTAPGSASAGQLTINGGTLAVTGGSTVPLSSTRGVAVGSSGGTFNLSVSTTLTYGGIIADVAGQNGVLKVTGLGSMVLSGTNTYSGGTVVSGGGTLSISANANLGATPVSPAPANVTLNGGMLQITAGTVGDTINANRGITLGTNGGTIQITTLGTGNLDNGGVPANSANAVRYAGAITGPGGLTINGGSGTNQGSAPYLFVFNSNASNYAGATTINNATVTNDNALANATILPATTVLTLTNHAIFGVWNGVATDVHTLAGLVGDNTSTIGTMNNGTATAFTINTAAATSYTFDGTIDDVQVLNRGHNDHLGAPISLTKTGLGTQILTGNNFYTGGTTISGGTLVVNNTSGSGTGTGAVNVNAGGTLAGTGVIVGNVNVNSGGILAPGTTTGGTLTVGTVVTNANLTLASGGILNYALNNVANSGNGLIVLTGNLSLAPTTLNINAYAGDLDNNTYQLITYSGTLTGDTTGWTVGTSNAGSAHNYVFSSSTPGEIDLIVSASTGGVPTGSGTWKNGSADGKWTTNTAVNSNWATGIPSAADQVATFDDTVLNLGTVDLDGNKTVGGVVLNTATAGYTLGLPATANTLTLQVTSGAAAITVTGGGSHTLNAKVITASNATISVAGGASLNMVAGLDNLNTGVNARTVTLSQAGAGSLSSGAVNNNGTLSVEGNASVATSVTTVDGTGTTNVGTVSGNGRLVTNHVVQNTLSIGNSTTPGVAKVTINASTPSSYTPPGDVTVPTGNSAGTSILTSLSIANNGTGTYYGTLDLKNNNLVLNYSGSSPIAAVRDALHSAYDSGAWDMAGLTSSSIALDPAKFTLGYGENHDSTTNVAYNNSTNLFDGTPVNAQSVLVKFTWQDDLTLDGKVDSSDAIVFGTNYDAGAVVPGGHTFAQGDLTYDGLINSNDAILFGTAYGTSFAQLPEPSSFLLAGLGLAGLLFARRRRAKTL